MDSNIWVFDYSEQREFNFFLMSDPHIGHPHYHQSKLIADLEKAKAKNARIYINGDVMDLFSIKNPYFNVSKLKKNKDAMINEYIKEAQEIFLPYVNNIDLISLGNHEANILKFSGIDPIDILVNFLNYHRDVKKYGYIKNGGYTGFIRQVFRNKQHRATKTFVIFYSHGTGGGAEVSKGMINLNRRQVHIIADMFWLGHMHTKLINGGPTRIWQKPNGQIGMSETISLVTGAYIKPTIQHDSSTEGGYTLNFGEQKQRVLQSIGGVMLTHKIKGHGLKLHTSIEMERTVF